MILEGTERRRGDGEGDRHGRERETDTESGKERETSTEERSLFGMSSSEEGSMCVFSGHAASTVSPQSPSQ